MVAQLRKSFPIMGILSAMFIVVMANVQLVTAGRPIMPPSRSAHALPVSNLRAGFISMNKDPRSLSWKDVSGDPRSRFYVIGNKERKNKMTFSLIGITAVAFVAQLAAPKVTTAGMKISNKIRNGEELYRLLTPVFLHGNLQHIATNMISLMRMGGNVEHFFGSGRYFSTYMVAGVAGNICSALASPTNSLGASGSVFGVIGAYAVFLTRNRSFLGQRGRQVGNSVLQTMVVNLVMGFFQPSIDQWAHLGGAIGGALMAFIVGPRLFYTKTPKGKVAVVDRPFWRAPPSAETIPSKISLKCKQLVSKLLRRPPPAIPAPEFVAELVPDPPVVAKVSKPKQTTTTTTSIFSPIYRFWNRVYQ